MEHTNWRHLAPFTQLLNDTITSLCTLLSAYSSKSVDIIFKHHGLRFFGDNDPIYLIPVCENMIIVGSVIAELISFNLII